MRFPEVDTAISALRSAVGVHHAYARSLLAQYLAVLVSGHYEAKIRDLVQARAQQTGDAELASFVEYAAGQILRNPDIDRIRRLLMQFGLGARTAFDSARSQAANGEQSVTYFCNIVDARHVVAHGGSPQSYTFEDVCTFYEGSHCVLDWLATALGV